MAQVPLTGLNENKNQFSLVDCYRVALDFGLPAAQCALDKAYIPSVKLCQTPQPLNPLKKESDQSRVFIPAPFYRLP